MKNTHVQKIKKIRKTKHFEIPSNVVWLATVEKRWTRTPSVVVSRNRRKNISHRRVPIRVHVIDRSECFVVLFDRHECEFINNNIDKRQTRLGLHLVRRVQSGSVRFRSVRSQTGFDYPTGTPNPPRARFDFSDSEVVGRTDERNNVVLKYGLVAAAPACFQRGPVERYRSRTRTYSRVYNVRRARLTRPDPIRRDDGTRWFSYATRYVRASSSGDNK